MRYSVFQIALKYLSYYFKSLTKHGVHPPFAYDFVANVLPLAKKINFKDIEQERNRLKQSNQLLQYIDFGNQGITKQISVKDLAQKALKNKKYASLIAASTHFYNYQNILELGTCLGITTAYLAKNAHKITTIEGGEMVLDQAKKVWNNVDLIHKIESVNADFDAVLPEILRDNQYDFIFIDGNHNKKATLSYFNLIMEQDHLPKCIVFDDIHWSSEMEEAWQEIQNDTRVSLTLDLFFLGYAFINPNLTKQHFNIRY